MGIQYTIYNIQYTIYNIQYTIYNIQYIIYNIQYMIYTIYKYTITVRRDQNIEQYQLIIVIFLTRTRFLELKSGEIGFSDKTLITDHNQNGSLGCTECVKLPTA